MERSNSLGFNGYKLYRVRYRRIYRPKTEGNEGYEIWLERISITYFEFKRLEMHSWPPYAKQPTFESSASKATEVGSLK